MSGPASMDEDEVIVVGAPLPRIAEVTIAGSRRVRITWRNGTEHIVDLAPVLLSHRHFIPLREDDDLFQTLRVNEDGNALEWDGEIELTAEWIERLPQVGMANQEFRQIMDRCGYTLEGMAAQLDLSRRIVASYRGTLPIPNHVALAAKYLAARFGQTDADSPLQAGFIQTSQVVVLAERRRKRAHSL